MAPDLSAPPATSWQDIQGLHNWEGLLAPLHPDLRDAGIRYGEFVEAVGDALDKQTSDTEYVYYSLFGKSKLFSSVGIQPGYIITRYLYSTVVVEGLGELFGLKEGASTVWIGYIAVSNDKETQRLGRRDVAVVFRGTVAKMEWWKDAHINLVEFKELGPVPFPKVLSGFLSMYSAADPSKMFGGLSLRDQIFKELKSLIQVQYSKEDMSITFAGHSLGGALAQLAAPDFGFNMPAVGGSRIVMVTAFVFGAPRTGNAVFKERADKSCKVIRIVDTGDPIPMVPPQLFDMYEHIGVEWKVNWADSPFVQELGELTMKCHNLELYLHCIAGQKTMSSEAQSLQRALIAEGAEDDAASVDVPEELHPLKELFNPLHNGLHKIVKEQAAIVKASRRMLTLSTRTRDEDGARSVKRLKTTSAASAAINFDLVVDRDPALVNKNADLLMSDLGVPPEWWVHGFKNMRSVDGKWLPRQKWPAVDIPSEDNPEFN